MNTSFAILQSLEQFDRWLFHKINSEWTTSFLDPLFILIRQPNIWMPLYLFLFVFVALNFKQNNWWWMLFFVCTVAMTDLAGTHLFKNVFERLRPCNDPLVGPSVRLLLSYCGGYSFVSNHAANHFGMATFFYFTMKRQLPRWARVGWIWALAISYAQIYVGIHYPTDVICGAFLGILLGSLTSRIFNKKFGFANFGITPTAP